MTPITGSIVALVTPMHEDGSVDYPTLRKLIDWHIAEGTDCIGVVGTTGESPTVNVDEHCEIIRVSVEQALNLICSMTGDGVDNPVTWTVRHDVVFITTKEKARGKPIPVNHDVQDLNFALTDFIGPRIDRIRLIDQLTDDDGGGPFATVGEHPQLITPEDLSVLVQENVAVNTWSQEGYSIEAAAGASAVGRTEIFVEVGRKPLLSFASANGSTVAGPSVIESRL